MYKLDLSFTEFLLLFITDTQKDTQEISTKKVLHKFYEYAKKNNLKYIIKLCKDNRITTFQEVRVMNRQDWTIAFPEKNGFEIIRIMAAVEYIKDIQEMHE